MPNAIAHIGAGGLLTRFLIRGADIKWVYLSCIIPDISWILRRFVVLVTSDIAPYDLRFYSALQASLFLSLILSFALSAFSRDYWRAFCVLATGSTIHLFLDALQIKMGNGSLMFVPFDMRLMSFRLFWPESYATYLLTLLGLIYFVFHLKRTSRQARDIVLPKGSRLFVMVLFLAMYLVLPFSLFDNLGAANYYSYLVFSDKRSNRIGKTVEFDRERYEYKSGKNCCLLYDGEMFILEGIDLKESANISLRGTFIDKKKIRVETFHVQKGKLRDHMSILGIAMIGLYWMFSIAGTIGRKEKGD